MKLLQEATLYKYWNFKNLHCLQDRANLLVLVKHFQSNMRGLGWACGGCEGRYLLMLYHWLILEYSQWLREGFKKIKFKKVNELFTLGGGEGGFLKYGGRLISTDSTPRRGQSKSRDVHVYITARSRWYKRQILPPFWFISSDAQTDRVFVVHSILKFINLKWHLNRMTSFKVAAILITKRGSKTMNFFKRFFCCWPFTVVFWTLKPC